MGRYTGTQPDGLGHAQSRDTQGEQRILQGHYDEPGQLTVSPAHGEQRGVIEDDAVTHAAVAPEERRAAARAWTAATMPRASTTSGSDNRSPPSRCSSMYSRA